MSLLPTRGPIPTDVETGRMRVFAALVALQDKGVAVGTSKQQVATCFRISLPKVAAIEREGLEKDWLEAIDSLDPVKVVLGRLVGG